LIDLTTVGVVVAAEPVVAPEEVELEEAAALVAEGAELVAEEEEEEFAVEAATFVAEEPVVFVEEATVVPEEVVVVADEALLDVVEFAGFVAAVAELLVVDAPAEDSDVPPEQAAIASTDTTRIINTAARFSIKTRLPMLAQPKAPAACRMRPYSYEQDRSSPTA
jgi:hypothetical protein